MRYNESMKLVRRLIKKLILEKRIRFVASSVLMTFLLSFSILFYRETYDVQRAFMYFIPLFILLPYILTFLSIWQGIEKIEWYTLFLMPVVFTVASYLFFMLMPPSWLTRPPYLVFYAVSFYAILLTSNIFNVGVEKSIQLYRAAFSVNYFYQTLVVFIASNIIYTFRFPYYLMGIMTFAILFFLALQMLWSVRPSTTIDATCISYAFFVAFFVMQVAMLLCFIPLQPNVYALAITTSYYVFVGFMHHHYDERLFVHTVREYLFVLLFVGAIIILTIPW